MGFKRKHLSADALIGTVIDCLEKEGLEEIAGSKYSWQDCVMSGLAVFGTKCPSLLQFEKKKATEPKVRRNLRELYQVNEAPSDTCLRERLDLLSPQSLRRSFKTIFSHLQRGKSLEAYRYLGGQHIVSIDGTGQFSSKKVSCKNCCKKEHRSGETTHYHHMVGASLVHPDQKVVIPFAPEAIINGDGNTKNDCEQNASKRLLKDLRREHPHLKLLIVQDALGANHPHLSLLDSLKMNYVIGIKPDSHKYLFEWIEELEPQTHTQKDERGSRHIFRFYHDVPLCDSHHDYRVNVIDYTEINKQGKEQHFTWITKMEVTPENVYAVMRAGRARWKIENGAPRKRFNCSR